MKSKVFFILQVLLIILPLVRLNYNSSETWKMLDWSGEEVPESECNGKGDDVQLIPKKMPRICWGKPESSSDARTAVTLTRKKAKAPGKKRKSRKGVKSRKVPCYKNIRIKMTEKCPKNQPIDCSEVRVNDFCQYGFAQLDGSITMYYPIHEPFSISVVFTKVSGFQPGKPVPPGSNIHVMKINGCSLFESLLCTRRRSGWCGCPIPWGRAPLFRARLHAAADFIPKRLGYGKFVGRADLDFPKGSSCVEFSFDRVEGNRPK